MDLKSMKDDEIINIFGRPFFDMYKATPPTRMGGPWTGTNEPFGRRFRVFCGIKHWVVKSVDKDTGNIVVELET